MAKKESYEKQTNTSRRNKEAEKRVGESQERQRDITGNYRCGREGIRDRNPKKVFSQTVKQIRQQGGRISIGQISGLFGRSRQSYYKLKRREDEKKQEEERFIKKVQTIRKKMPRIGTRKLHYILTEELKQEGIKLGRDKMFEILGKNGMLIKKRRRYVQTTNSKHWLKKYPNLIKGVEIERPEKLWVSDITYIKTDEGFCYLTMITDAYSRKIVGYNTSKSLGNEGTIKALKMAIKKRKTREELIHHSDRGLQYCSKEYVELLEANKIKISMTEQSDPYENALAERMNRTIKEEFLMIDKFRDYQLLKRTVAESVDIYNTERPHLSCAMQYPADVHEQKLTPVGLRPPGVNQSKILTNLST